MVAINGQEKTPFPVRGRRCLSPWEALDAAEERTEHERLEAEERRLVAPAMLLGAVWRAEQGREPVVRSGALGSRAER